MRARVTFPWKRRGATTAWRSDKTDGALSSTAVRPRSSGVINEESRIRRFGRKERKGHKINRNISRKGATTQR